MSENRPMMLDWVLLAWTFCRALLARKAPRVHFDMKPGSKLRPSGCQACVHVCADAAHSHAFATFSVEYGINGPKNVVGFVDGVRDPFVAELAGITLAILRYPSHRELSVIGSKYALSSIRSNSVGVLDEFGCEKCKTACRCTNGEGRLFLVVLRWLLRLRSAKTSFYKACKHQTQPTCSGDGSQTAPPSPIKCALPPRHLQTVHAYTYLWTFLRCQIGWRRADGVCAGSPLVPARKNPKGSESDAAEDLRCPVPFHAGVRPVSRDNGADMSVTGVLALDCEMVGVGSFGQQSVLASVCVVNEYGNIVYFSYSLPAQKVTDYRTKYSGIKKGMLDDAPSFESVRLEVMQLIKDKIVVGHSVDNDLTVLGIGHPIHLIRDTADFRPWKLNGKPQKLRHLARDILKLRIQSGPTGHCAHEDAMAAMYLYLHRRNEFERYFAARYPPPQS
jgi:RNA exonuclease 4